MTGNFNKKQRIIYFINHGYSNREIATVIPDVSERYIRKIRSDIGASTRKISPKEYYQAIMNNTDTKEHLAAELGVSKRTLCRFEGDNETKKQIAGYMRIKGMGLRAIAEKMGTNICTLKGMGIDKLPNINVIKYQINSALEILKIIAQWDDEAATLFYQWKRASEHIK